MSQVVFTFRKVTPIVALPETSLECDLGVEVRVAKR